ncbi:hypothetical protein Taro_000062 [Colocasia esculenta]|uniref:Uncharacterized protein n=1 Tax=Colocasia esculenta TaxID=4460 RepID=A0A843T6M8_COLES|nr:hypothetical protein [Colocasia esculenta]
MGCEGYYECPAWEGVMGLRGWRGGAGSSPYGEANLPACCGVPYRAIRGINLTRLACEWYNSAYGLAPHEEAIPPPRVTPSAALADALRSAEGYDPAKEGSPPTASESPSSQFVFYFPFLWAVRPGLAVGESAPFPEGFE